MMFIEDVPERGILIVNVFFKGYKDYYPNESRRNLRNIVPNKVRKIGLNLEPLQFSLIRSIEGSNKRCPECKTMTTEDKCPHCDVKTHSTRIGQSVGVEYQYRYKDISKEKFKETYDEIKNYCENSSMWSTCKIMYADDIGEI